MPAASRLEGEAAARLRSEVIAGPAAKQSFGGRDLTGADLSKLDLSGADFAGAMLEAADLAGANLAARGGSARRGARGADLDRAPISRARKLAGSNLGLAILRGVKAGGGVDLSRAILAKADLGGADLRGARMVKTDLAEARFDATDMRDDVAGGRGSKLFFCVSICAASSSPGAVLHKMQLPLDRRLRGRFQREPTLSGAVFVTAKGDGAVFKGATLDNLRVVERSSFAGADFRGALLEKANLRGTNLEGCDFSGARLARSGPLRERSLADARPGPRRRAGRPLRRGGPHRRRP